MPLATIDDFRAQHARAITRLYTLARGRRWGLAEIDFGVALHRSQAAHFRSASHAGKREVERYLQSLDLADLALVAACRRDIPHAWQTLHSDYLPVLQEAARATLPDADAARGKAEALFAELHGPRGEVLEQYHGRSRLKTWLRAVVARLHDAEIRSPGAIAVEGADADPWFAALGETLAALEPPDRLRLAAYALERLPLASTATMLGETRLTAARRMRRIGAALRRDVVRRLSRESGLDRREIRRIERAASGVVPEGDRRTPMEASVAVAFERRLNAPGRQCPPPATLASLVEGRLGEAERHSTVLHASSCRGCVRQLGVLARLERPGLAAEALALGRRSSLRAIATVVGAFVVLGAGVFALDEAGVLRDALRALAPPAAGGPERDGLDRSGEGGIPPADEAGPLVAIPGETPEAEREPPLASGSAATPEASASEPDAAAPRADAIPEETAIPPAAVSPAAPATGSAPSPVAPAATPTAEPTRTTTPIATPTSEPTRAPTARPTDLPSPVPTRTRIPIATRTPMPTAAPRPTRTPSPTAPPSPRPEPRRALHPGDQPGATVIVLAPGTRDVRWWLAANGALAHTHDGGRRWTPIPSGVDADLLCGAAPSDRAVWIGGRSGTVLRSLDGTSFARVASPSAEDVVSIAATDAARATVTTASGARWTTDDGGASWRRR